MLRTVLLRRIPTVSKSKVAGAHKAKRDARHSALVVRLRCVRMCVRERERALWLASLSPVQAGSSGSVDMPPNAGSRSSEALPLFAHEGGVLPSVCASPDRMSLCVPLAIRAGHFDCSFACSGWQLVDPPCVCEQVCRTAWPEGVLALPCYFDGRRLAHGGGIV